MAQSEAKVLAKLFREEGRSKLKQNGKGAVRDAGGSDDLGDFFDGLSDQEIDTLFKTWDAMDRMGFKGEAGGATVSFL